MTPKPAVHTPTEILRLESEIEELLSCLKEAYRFLDPTSKYAAGVLHDRILQAIAKAEAQ